MVMDVPKVHFDRSSRISRVPQGDRDLAAESMYEYGSRVGFWRIHDLFRKRALPLTVFASAVALELLPQILPQPSPRRIGISVPTAHRWIEHYHLSPEAEAEQIAMAHASLLSTIGRAPRGLVLQVLSVDQHARARRGAWRL